MKFIEKLTECKTKFNNKYKYDEDTVCKVTDSINIVCPIHGNFKQVLRVHLRSKHGCPKCADIASSIAQKQSTENFIHKAKRVHGERYLYAKTEYKGDKKKLIITCKEHGDFEQDPYSHINKSKPCGCPICGVISTNSKQRHSLEMITKLLSANTNSNISIDLSTYTNFKSKLKCTCKFHGEFNQTLPILIKSQYKCPRCAELSKGWNRSLYKDCPTIFYCLSISSDLYKVGITKNTNIFKRYGSKDSLEIKKVIYETTFDDGALAWDLERKVMLALRDYKYTGPKIFKYTGTKEIFTINPLEIIQKEIAKWQQN